MSLKRWKLAWRLLWTRPVMTGLHVLLLALGWATVTLVLLLGEQVERRLQRDLAGVDLVVGAKGSPLQIVLAGLFHIDAPTGNIPLDTVQRLRKNPLVQDVWPLSMGDSIQGWRIVGAEATYLNLQQAQLSAGRVWSGPMEAVLGATVARQLGLGLGAVIKGSHGLGATASEHADAYHVVGVLRPCGCAMDQLVLTDLTSIWQVHEEHHGESAGEIEPEHHADDSARPREVTVALVRYRSPLGVALVPRTVQAEPGLQAASPALESARLMRVMGVGREVLQVGGFALLASAVLSVLIALLTVARERQADWALLRMLGATPRWLVGVMVAQSLGLAGLGLGLGWALAHGIQGILATVLQQRNLALLDPTYFSVTELGLVLAGVGLALVAAVLPAWRVLRADVLSLLQSRH
ncbi:ABC transporter permease [Inhella gelatinilytica]|uniref:ABC transporter permease n=1 Tax=Inhella gelatinilytica TaxID=2795030 RepID=A0A931NEY8_9BURK|nr:ABC transporter permease [Inhella gelatinilytica]MBH9552996.1 ABC transporter permease [Inhella gelatinilytica]